MSMSASGPLNSAQLEVPQEIYPYGRGHENGYVISYEVPTHRLN